MVLAGFGRWYLVLLKISRLQVLWSVFLVIWVFGDSGVLQVIWGDFSGSVGGFMGVKKVFVAVA